MNAQTPAPDINAAPTGHPDDLRDAARWRTLCANFGNERDEATPGKQHDILIRLNADGCVRMNLLPLLLALALTACGGGSDDPAPAARSMAPTATQEHGHGL